MIPAHTKSGRRGSAWRLVVVVAYAKVMPRGITLMSQEEPHRSSLNDRASALDDAWPAAIEGLHTRPMPLIDWPDERRWLVGSDGKARQPLPKPVKVLKCEPRLPRTDVDDAAVLIALNGLGAANAPAVARALAVSTPTAWRRLESLERAGAVLRSAAHVWSVA